MIDRSIIDDLLACSFFLRLPFESAPRTQRERQRKWRTVKLSKLDSRFPYFGTNKAKRNEMPPRRQRLVAVIDVVVAGFVFFSSSTFFFGLFI